ncbi:hypothetical protein ACF082_34495 [Streptomyces lydicus]|uniref:hypothetical protein n=1 Tax=Streptomyces lydicus TaxID=47763 RepID=UPI0037008F9C
MLEHGGGLAVLAVRKLRRSCEKRLSDLPLPDPFTLDGLVANIGEKLGRTINLVPIDDDGDMRTACGLRVKTPTRTFILYRRRSSVVQDQHVIFHELTHEWLDHTTDLSPDELQCLVPHEIQQFIAQFAEASVVQARSSRYATLQELEAELGAVIIGRLRARCRPSGSDFVSQLERTLCHPVAPPRRDRS